MHNSRQLPPPGTEIVISNPEHTKYDEIGMVLGQADSTGIPRLRVLIDDHIYLCNLADIMEN